MHKEFKWVNKLSGARLFIIGGTSGIGFGVAEASVEHGVSSRILSSSPKTRLEEANSKLNESYPNSSTDITARIVDHIVFTAGVALALKPFGEVDFESMKQTGTVRFFGALLVARYGHKNHAPSHKSSIILTSSVSSKKPISGWTVTRSYLSGLHGTMRGLAYDLKPIRVSLVTPGGVDTEMWNILDQKSRVTLIKGLKRQTTTGHVGTVESVAEAYLYRLNH
ncbi:short-chain dehydrogenases/reductase, putative [Talaromyces stipitatus ATCC 10500]|uniref:Short-chain dehydrogenases/reductase, putative n=1 Tax=Talaromyces stipitatus (strain ATCC 10500 / CBS 375.48 / QM 6759 / NRRL 1006) TaxID=441959 RepID=B8MG95_TALSN|nr:short-chain dehydrogenases/reductase, putative [Talaromyces stipitatus ATCC 10500]EED16215.1 short-chain dehydrogenases/reductase, putative [Talaromyces stipitatus ATCC 10500]